MACLNKGKASLASRKCMHFRCNRIVKGTERHFRCLDTFGAFHVFKDSFRLILFLQLSSGLASATSSYLVIRRGFIGVIGIWIFHAFHFIRRSALLVADVGLGALFSQVVRDLTVHGNKSRESHTCLHRERSGNRGKHAGGAETCKQTQVTHLFVIEFHSQMQRRVSCRNDIGTATKRVAGGERTSKL